MKSCRNLSAEVAIEGKEENFSSTNASKNHRHELRWLLKLQGKSQEVVALGARCAQACMNVVVGGSSSRTRNFGVSRLSILQLFGSSLHMRACAADCSYELILVGSEFARWKSAANAHKSSARALRPRLRVGGGGVIQVVGAVTWGEGVAWGGGGGGVRGREENLNWLHTGVVDPSEPAWSRL